MRRRFLAFASLGLILLGASCGSNAVDQIREANAAARAGSTVEIEPDTTATIHSNDLRVGDCFNSAEAVSGGDVEDVEVVLCSAQWQFILVDSCETTREGSYPGEAFFQEEFEQRCDLWATDSLYPLEDNWDQGNRKIDCVLQFRALFSPEAGSCYAYDFNTEEPLTVSFRTSCDAPHTLEAFALAKHRGSTYPGNDATAVFAEDECLAAFDDYVGFPFELSEVFAFPLTPSRATWTARAPRRLLLPLHPR